MMHEVIDLPLIIPSARAKRIVLKVVPEAPHVRISLPIHMKPEHALAFYQEKQRWVAKKLEQITAVSRAFLIWGKPMQIKATGGVRDRTYQEGDILYVGGAPEHQARRIQHYLTSELRSYLHSRILQHTEQLGVKAGTLRIKMLRSRFGSCTSTGTLTFSYYLIFAPKEVVDYVVAHEVAHLKEMNHSTRFWRLVATLCPSYEQHRYWLKRHGMQLFVSPLS